MKTKTSRNRTKLSKISVKSWKSKLLTIRTKSIEMGDLLKFTVAKILNHLHL